MYYVGASAGEKYYLRRLLLEVGDIGPRSFEDIRTVDGIHHDTFRAACVARGLLQDDQEWDEALREAAMIKSGRHLRSMFAIMLMNNKVASPLAFWDAQKVCGWTSVETQCALD